MNLIGLLTILQMMDAVHVQNMKVMGTPMQACNHFCLNQFLRLLSSHKYKMTVRILLALLLLIMQTDTILKLFPGTNVKIIGGPIAQSKIAR